MQTLHDAGHCVVSDADADDQEGKGQQQQYGDGWLE